jgi:Protease inhibitor Inh
MQRWYHSAMRYAVALLVALFVADLGWQVQAQQAPAGLSPAASAAFKAVIGKWEISNADRDRTCTVTFRTDPAGNAFKIEMDKACPAQMPEVKDAVAWTIGGLDLVRLLDNKGKPVMEFTEVESGTYEAQRPGEGVFFMQSAAEAASPVGLAADQMAGEWSVVRGSGKTICTITLTNTAAGPDNFTLRVKPGCDALVTRFGPSTWYMDRGELVLKSARGQFWRFEESDPVNWTRVPEGREPITMVRQ